MNRGERIAALAYLARGYRILDANVPGSAGASSTSSSVAAGGSSSSRSRSASARDTVRRRHREPVGPEKRRRVERAARAWLAAHPETRELDVRLEAAAVTGRGSRAGSGIPSRTAIGLSRLNGGIDPRGEAVFYTRYTDRTATPGGTIPERAHSSERLVVRKARVRRPRPARIPSGMRWREKPPVDTDRQPERTLAPMSTRFRTWILVAGLTALFIGLGGARRRLERDPALRRPRRRSSTSACSGSPTASRCG